MDRYMSEKPTKKGWIIWLCAVMFYFYEFMIQVSPGVMAQDLMRDFNIHATSLGNLSAYYFYSYASMQLVVGVLLDNWGPRKLLSLSSIACVVGCYLFSRADVLLEAELSRLLIGAGSACAVISAFKLSTSWFPERYFGIMTGLTVMVGMLGAIFGEAPLAWVIHSFGWRHSMLGFSAVGIVLALLIWTIVRDAPDNIETKITLERTDVLGNMWVVLKNRQTWLTSIYGGLMFAPTTALGALWGVPWMCTYYSLDRSTAAHIISFLFLGWVIGSPLSGILSNYFGRCKVTMHGATISAFTIICMLIFINSWSQESLKFLWFCFGLASSGFLPFMTIIRRQYSHQMAGTAMGFGNAMNMIGGALLQPIIGLFLDQNWNGTVVNGVRIYTSSGYKNALVIVPVLIAVSYIILLMVKEEGQRALIRVKSSSKLQQTFSSIIHGGNKMFKKLIILLAIGSSLTFQVNASAVEEELIGTANEPAQQQQNKLLVVANEDVQNNLHSSDSGASAGGESAQNQNKLYAVVDDKLEEGLRANAIAHMSVGLGALLGSEALRTTPYISADGIKFCGISEHPFILLKGKSSKLREFHSNIVADGSIPYVTFLDTMHLGPTFKEQIEATRSKPAKELKVLGVALFGSPLKLPLLKKFSLLR